MASLALAVPLTAVSVIGLLLNGYILFVVLVTEQVRTANDLLLLHLGAVDALLCLVFLVFSAPEMLEGWPWLGLGAPCSLHGFLFTLLHPVASWTVCGLNCDRYYAIASPLRYGSVVNPRKVAIGLGLAWLIALLLCLPPLFLVAPYRFNPGLGGCAPDFGEEEGAIWYSLAYTTFSLLLPAVLILGCNLRVLSIARHHRHRIASAIFEVTISAQVTITHQRNPFFMPSGSVFRGRRAASTVLQLIGSFLVLYLPYYGVILWESSSPILLAEWRASSTGFHSLLVTLASTLLNCSPPVNGLLYGVKNKMLRKSFQNYRRKQMSRSEMDQEIQGRTPSICGSRRPSPTPLAFFSRPNSSHLQRRSSEVGLERLDRSKTSARRRPEELARLPRSTTGVDLETAEPPRKSRSLREAPLSERSGCNVLRMPPEAAFHPPRGALGTALAAVSGPAQRERCSNLEGTSSAGSPTVEERNGPRATDRRGSDSTSDDGADGLRFAAVRGSVPQEAAPSREGEPSVCGSRCGGTRRLRLVLSWPARGEARPRPFRGAVHARSALALSAAAEFRL